MKQEHINLAFLGSRPISLKALDLVRKYIDDNPDKRINLSVLTKSDDNPPAGVIKWWSLGKLRKKAYQQKMTLLKSEKDLNSNDFDLITMVFFNDIVPASIIQKVPRGITNLHFGYLPSSKYSLKKGSPHKAGQPYSKGTYRGSNILSHAILNGEKWQAVTFHFISEKIDLGPVIEYAWNQINKDTTSWDLQVASEEKALSMFKKYLPKLIETPFSIKTLTPGKFKYPYFNRTSLDSIKVLNHRLSDTKLELVARALSFPNTEPPYFIEKDAKGEKMKRYVLFKKGKGLVMLKPQKQNILQNLKDIT